MLGMWKSGFNDAGSGKVAMQQVVAQRRDRDSRAHLVSQVITKLGVGHEEPVSSYCWPLCLRLHN
jgi:hypothetical protein